MWRRRSGLIPVLFLVVAALGMMAQNAHAEPYRERVNEFYVTTGPDYTKTENIITGVGTITTYPQRMLDYIDQNGYEHYIDYRLTQNSTHVILETQNSNSFAWSKSACSYNLYHSGTISGQGAKINNISWSVKGKAANATSWSSLNPINNAACVTDISEEGNGVTLTGTKTNGQGTFQIKLEYIPGYGIKETMRAYNNNILWNNHNIGFSESLEVPRFVWFGGQQYDLSQYNGTTLNRNWIISNQAKLIKLTDKMIYDFGIGFDNLNDVTIKWQNNKATLTMNYLYPSGIVPYQQWVEVDPTLAAITGTWSRILDTASVGASCSPTASANATTQNVPVLDDSTLNTVCGRGLWRFSLASLPAGTYVTSATFNNTITVLSGTNTCNLMPMVADPFTQTIQQQWDDIGDGTPYFSNSATCSSTGLKTYTLPDAAISDINSGIPSKRFSIGYKFYDETRPAGTDRRITHTGGQLTLVYATTGIPNSVTTLAAGTPTSSTVSISWSQPSLNGGTLSGYRINYTSPCSTDPLTVLVSNTGTSTTSYDVSSLSPATCYTFRVSAVTNYGANVTYANTVNVTTLAFNQANYTIGSFNFDATNPVLFPIRFERIDNGSSDTRVNVTFSNTISLACDLRYTYSMTNHTYHSISSIPISTTENEASFRFTNSSNDITTFHCWNEAGNETGNYVLTQTDFLLKQQVRDFRNGTYGTMGQLGAFDFITLIVVIIAMIGLNKTNEAVAGFFCIVAISVLAYFEIIQWYIALISALAVIILLAVSATRKD